MMGRRVVVVLAMVLIGSLVTGCGSSPHDVGVRSAGEQPGTAGPESKVEDRVAVGDGAGAVRGTVSGADEDDRRHRIGQRVVDEGLFGVPEDADAETRRAILDALLVLDPVEVRDEAGKLTGYLTTHFVSVADYPAERDAAEAQLERHRGDR